MTKHYNKKGVKFFLSESGKAHLILSRASDELEISSLKKISLLLHRKTIKSTINWDMGAI